MLRDGTLVPLQKDGRPWGQTVYAIQSDPSGALWFGTSRGLYIRRAAITVIGPPEGLPSGNIYPVLQDRTGAVFQDGLIRLAGDRVIHYSHENGALPVSDVVLSLHEDREGTLWVGGDRLCWMDGGHCRVVEPEAFQSSKVRAIHEDAAGRLWVGTNNGLFRRRADCTGPACWTRFTTADGLPHNNVRVIHERPSGALWMGTNGGGLVRFKDGDFDALTAADGLSSNLIRAIYEDTRGVLWVGTEDAGLLRIDPRTAIAVDAMPITTYREADGLFDDVIHQILPDGYRAERRAAAGGHRVPDGSRQPTGLVGHRRLSSSNCPGT